MLSPQWLDELRSRITLSGVISRTTRLQKAGREFKACCPFHNEKTPSFTVNDEKGFYHCLAGETLVETKGGRYPIRDLAGRSELVLTTGGVWKEAAFKSFGKQRLWKVSLTRNRQGKTIYATDGHRWFTRGRKSALSTRELRAGYRLQTVRPAPREDWEFDPRGVRHGIVFGDGTVQHGRYGHVHLHGAKDRDLAKWFDPAQISEHTRDNGETYVRVYGGRAFETFKALPDGSTNDAYRLGFLAGYIAADGHVAKDGTIMLNSSDRSTLQFIRDMALRLGLVTYGVTKQVRRGIDGKDSELFRIHFARSTFNEALLLLPVARKRFAQAANSHDRLRWTVVSVEPTDRNEEVYCAEVPETHAFALDDNILTGNCFGCGAHGDAIRWMTDQRGLSFMDAVKELAAEAGMDVPAPDPRAAERAEKRDTLHDVMKAAQDWFVDNLRGPDGAQAREYLKSRGFDAHTVERFGFGFAPENRQALKQALSRFPEEMLIEAGLRIAVEGRDPYDRFRGRLMLPIEDTRGRVIAFGGRILQDREGAPKYLNSPDTPLFDKGRTLYNLHRAAPAARQSGRVIVVEGYMDVIALAAAGIEECVAPLGTALTEMQIELLWRQVETPILCFDGDAAGQRAAMRAVSRALPMLKPGHSLRIVTLPAGLDPDDLLKRDGRPALEALLEDARTLLDTIWLVERDAQPLDTPEDKAGLKARLLAHVDTISDQDIRALYRRDLLDRFSAFAFPKKQFSGGNFRRGIPLPARPSPANIGRLRRATGGGARAALLGSVVQGLVLWPDEIGRNAEALAKLTTEEPRIDVLLEAFDSAETLESGELRTIFAGKGLHLPGSNEQERMRFPFLSADGEADFARKVLRQAIDLLVEQPALEAASNAALKRYEADLTDESRLEHERLLKRKLEFEARLRQMAETKSAAPDEGHAKSRAD